MFKHLGEKILMGGKRLGHKIREGSKWAGQKIYQHRKEILMGALGLGASGLLGRDVQDASQFAATTGLRVAQNPVGELRANAPLIRDTAINLARTGNIVSGSTPAFYGGRNV